MFSLFLIEITREHAWIFFYGAISVILSLGLLSVAIKNIRVEMYQPIYNFFIEPVVTRRRKTTELHEKVDKLTELTKTIEHEVKTNSGSSLKDAVKRIERSQHYFFSKLRHDAQFSNECLFETDASGNVTFVNRALCELLNVETFDLLNRAWLSRIEPAIRERVKNEWKDSIENKIPFDSKQDVIDGRNGELFSVRVQAQPHLDESGNLAGFFGHVQIAK